MFNMNRPTMPGQQRQQPSFGNAPSMPSPFMNNLMQGNGIPPPWSSGTFMPPGQNQMQGQGMMTPPSMPPQAQGGGMMPQAFPGQGTGTGPGTWPPPPTGGAADFRVSQNPMFGGRGMLGQSQQLPGLAGAIQGMQPGQLQMSSDDQNKLRMLIQQYLMQIRGY